MAVWKVGSRVYWMVDMMELKTVAPLVDEKVANWVDQKAEQSVGQMVEWLV